MNLPVIGYAGLTHLGLCSAVAAAERGFQVIGFDPDPARVDALGRGELPVSEPSLAELLRSNAARLRFTSKPEDLQACHVAIVSADAPTDDAGASDLQPIEDLLGIVTRHVGPEAVRVLLSQLPPGFTRAHAAGSSPLYCQVETLIFGRAMERALNPERFIVGCPDPGVGLPDVYARFLAAFGCPILPMRYESAELAKISINACLVASISATNVLAELCERVGADWSEIRPALRLDARIGEKAYLDPGLGIAGGNLERDLATLCRMAEDTGSDARVVRAWLDNSAYRRDAVLRLLHEHVLGAVREPRIAVLGLAYKRDTDSTRNSPALALIRALPQVEFAVFDPRVAAGAVSQSNVRAATTALEACRDVHAVALMTPWPQFAKLDPARLADMMRGRVVLDPYGVLDASSCHEAGLHYHTLGAPPRT